MDYALIGADDCPTYAIRIFTSLCHTTGMPTQVSLYVYHVSRIDIDLSFQID